MKIKRIIALLTTAACALSLAACGKEAENDTVNNINSAGQGSSSETSSSTSGSSTSDEASEGEEQKPAEEDVEKIPLSIEELNGYGDKQISISDDTILFLREREDPFDVSVSIDSIELLDYVIGTLAEIIETDEADDYEYEYVEDEVGGFTTEYFYFTPETAEKLIREIFLPSFKISSIDYTKSVTWNEESGSFKVTVFWGIPNYNGKEYFIESGYEAGEYWYVISALSPSYYNAFLFGPIGIELSHLPSGYFDNPRMQLKFKNTSHGRALVGYEMLEELPEWLEAAAYLFNTIDWENSSYSSASYISVGVMDGNIGKRMFIAYGSGMGSIHLMASSQCDTYGLRGKNDYICCMQGHELITASSPDGDKMITVTNDSITVQDNFKGETYGYTYHNSNEVTFGDAYHEPIEETSESYVLNDMEISKDEFNSADVVAYFDGVSTNSDGMVSFDDKTLVYECEHSIKEITLADLYEITQIMIE